MTLILEDGTGVHDANSYATAAMADAYFATRGNAAWTGLTVDKEYALIRATQYIESTYRSRWPGVRLKFPQIQSLADVQGLSWPRYGALDYEGFPILPNQIPQALINGTCEAALRELSIPGQLQPDLTLGIKRQRAGDTEIEYWSQYSNVAPVVTILDGILAPILLTNNANFGFTERVD